METRRIGKYEVNERLGRGGMAEVYRAYHVNLDRYVAIKILHKFLADDSEFKSRFEREAQNIARLRHEHIVQVYDFDFDVASESYYMVMELVEGETLKDRLFDLEKAGRVIDLREALRIARQAATALAYAHKNGMIHRDVKPANLMLDQNDNDRVVLTDFGIAKLLTSGQFTATGGLIGTPAYMSPEQGVGESGDERSDLYSLGVILYQMVTGELPYDADTPLALVLKHVNEAIPSASMVAPSLPAQVDDIIEKAMAKDINRRYQNATTMIADIEALEEALEAGDIVPDESLPPVVTTINPIKRDRTTLHGNFDRPTVRLNEDTNPIMAVNEIPTQGCVGRWSTVIIGFVLAVIVIAGVYVGGASAGFFPAVAFLASETPSPTATITEASPTEPAVVVEETPTVMPTETLTATATATASPSATVTATRTSTPTPSATATPTATNTLTPTATATDDPATATPTFNATATIAAERSATFASCVWDYGIAEQTPEDGEDGGFFTTNTDYERTIVLVNTGTCTWERNTALTFIEGESFNAGPRIFIREEVPVGEDVAIVFSGETPARGRVENGEVVPVEGTWQLRTPNQTPIGEPFMISVLVYNPGT